MKFSNMIRTQLVIGGISAAFLFAGVAKAQEIENTSFPDGPYTMAYAQPVPAQQAINAPVVPSASQEVQAVDAAASVPAPAEEPFDGVMWTGVTLVWIGAIGVYFVGPAKRLTRGLRSVGNLTPAANGQEK